MIDFADILANFEDQERGSWLDLLDPVTGAAIGIRFLIVGPDSATARRARITLMDDLAELADPEGRVSGENREKARIASLARCVKGWEIEEDGKPVPFSHKACVRVLSAGSWIQEAVDAFAANRTKFRGAA